jgi:2'-5' RNA ligase
MRLFVAIDINDDVRKAVAKLEQELKGRLKNQKGLKWVEPENMHLTLKFLGEVSAGSETSPNGGDENRIDEINDALEMACLEKNPFEIDVSVVGTFGRPAKVLWLGSEKESDEIVKLAGDIEQALEELGFEKEVRPFSAHLTLARIKNNIGKNLQQLLKDYSKVNPVRDKESGIPDGRQGRPVSNGVKIPAISVDSVCLYKSQLTSDGPVYTLLRKIELKKDI